MSITLKASEAVAYYSGEVNTNIPLAGYLTGYRVMRYTFTTPETGADSYSISITGVSMYSSSFPTLRFYLTTSPTSHINASDSTADYDGELIRSSTGSGESGQYKYTSEAVSKLLTPNTTYYLYIFAGGSGVRSAYFPYDGLQYKTELATITVEGAAGLVYIDNGSSFEPYQVYVDNGSDWDLYIPYIDNGSDWEMYS